MKKLFSVIIVMLPLCVFFAVPKITFAEEIRIDNPEVINDSESSEEEVDEDEPETKEEIKEPEKEKPEILAKEPIKVEVNLAPVIPVEVPKLENTISKKKVATSAKMIPKVQGNNPSVAPEMVAAAVVPRKVIPANPSFSPNKYPENSTLVLFSKVRPALIIIAVLYLAVSTLYLKKDARKWKQSHWQ